MGCGGFFYEQDGHGAAGLVEVDKSVGKAAGTGIERNPMLRADGGQQAGSGIELGVGCCNGAVGRAGDEGDGEIGKIRMIGGGCGDGS